jgi:hypothetical protein
VPRRGSIASDIVDYLRRKPQGATTDEIREALAGMRRFEVLPHSVRSALYQHLDDAGEQLFVRVGRGRYRLRK